MLEVMAINVSNMLFLSYPGDISVPTNVIIGIGVGSTVLSMAGILMVMVIVATYVYIKRKRKKNGYTTGMFPNVLT